MSQQNSIPQDQALKVEGDDNSADNTSSSQASKAENQPVKEVNGPKGLEPTRYGDWESNGRCHDF
ncbi:MAG: succinate dehydrogenase assembly factor 4 [Pseudomonadota bacterium]